MEFDPNSDQAEALDELRIAASNGELDIRSVRQRVGSLAAPQRFRFGEVADCVEGLLLPLGIFAALALADEL
jgi:hypothetical protein